VGNTIASAAHGIASSIEYPASIPREILEELFVFERCAACLLEALTRARQMNSLPANVAETIRKAAMKETKSTMHAQVDARELSSLATRLGIPIVVLKGGVRAISGSSPAFPIVDIDILVPRDKVAIVVAELEKSGFGKARPPLAHHQGLDPTDDRLSVEVHWSLLGDGLPVDPKVWDRIEPIVNAPGLFSLGRADNLVHVVRHALENHRHRPVSLRDSLLAATVAESCSREELDNARRELQKIPNSVEALETISFGEYLVGRGSERTGDPFVRKCAAFYATVAVGPRLPRVISSPAAMAFVSDVAVGRVGFLRAARESLQWRGTGVEPLSRIGDRFPLVTHPLVGLAHLAYYSVAAAVALPLVRRARDKAIREFDQRSV